MANRACYLLCWFHLGFVVTLLGLSLAQGAPAPLPKPPAAKPGEVDLVAPKHLKGEWSLTWHGDPWDLSLAAGGDYACRRSNGEGPAYFGKWLVSPAGHLLVYEEHYFSGPNPVFTNDWYVIWDRLPSGKVPLADLKGKAHWQASGAHETDITFARKK